MILIFVFQTCVNEVPFYSCSVACLPGFAASYAMDGSIASCQDIDECGQAVCDAVTQNCVNTNGRYGTCCVCSYDVFESEFEFRSWRAPVMSLG